jgi:hypothetical protein
VIAMHEHAMHPETDVAWSMDFFPEPLACNAADTSGDGNRPELAPNRSLWANRMVLP